MSDKTLTHPERDVLSAFGLGKLESDRAKEVEAHITECEPCCRTLLDLQGDSFVDLVRSSNEERHSWAEADARLGDTSSQENDEGGDFSEVPTELLNHPRYRTGELLGRGGMGAVYKAEHRLMNRLVALKVINQELLAKPTVVERFRREAQAAAQLSHPNIVTAYDAEQAGDAHFLVLEYVEGTDLSAFVEQRGPLPLDVACNFIYQASLGLQHAHEHGMVHRDIKPHNLMVTSDDRVKILDFGLATLSAEVVPVPSDLEPIALRDRLTNIGSTMGTPDFISPEQAQDAHAADARSDIYSLGCTLYFLLAGHPPFPTGSTAEKLRAHRQQEPQPIELVRRDVPERLAAIVHRMMAKNPAARFQTSAELADAIKSFVAPLQNANSQHRLVRIIGWTVGMGVPVVALVVGVVFALSGDSRPTDHTPVVMPESRPRRNPERSDTEKTTPDINESKEYPGVYHSPSAETMPRVYRSIFQLELVVKRGENEAQVEYADGTVVSGDGLIATVLDEPGTNQAELGGIESAEVLMLDGSSVTAEVVSYAPAYGVAILRVKGVEFPPLTLSQKPLVAKRRVMWHAVYKEGRKTFLYTRPLQIYKSAHTIGETTDLCQIIDHGSSALSAIRSGSALVSHDGTLVALMGRQQHWHVTPKNTLPRTKLAWAVPASVIAQLIKQ